MSTLPWFTNEEIKAMCEPLRQNAARVRYLRDQGLTVTVRPNGTPLVMREQAEKVLSGLKHVQDATNDAPAGRAAPKPDRAAFKLIHGRKGA